MFYKNLNDGVGSDVYIIDMGFARQPTVSIAHTQKASWMLHANVLLPAAQAIDLTIAEHESMVLTLENAIRQAYGSGVWPEHLDADKVRSTQLSGLTKLQRGPEKRYVEGDPSFPMLLNMHERFANAAADAISLARADKVEEAYALLTGQYARASRQVVWLLKNLKQRIHTPKATTSITLATLP